jgi:hypothetical protein
MPTLGCKRVCSHCLPLVAGLSFFCVSTALDPVQRGSRVFVGAPPSVRCSA